jgi:hypothetical protein
MSIIFPCYRLARVDAFNPAGYSVCQKFLLIAGFSIPLVQRGTFKGNSVSSPLWKRRVRGGWVFGIFAIREKTLGFPKVSLRKDLKYPTAVKVPR